MARAKPKQRTTAAPLKRGVPRKSAPSVSSNPNRTIRRPTNSGSKLSPQFLVCSLRTGASNSKLFTLIRPPTPSSR
jgi:hypothetical protein